MGRIYIAGPMRGYKYFNFPAFDAARDELVKTGWGVISPADLDRCAGFDAMTLSEDTDWTDVTSLGFSLEDAITRDLDAVKQSDAIYLLNGWENSRGALTEKALAEWRGMEIRYQRAAEVDVLEEALRITKGDRQATYGPPDQDFARTAAMWSAIKGIPFEAKEVALFMIALKISRETHQRKRDNLVDIAGYARCASFCK